MVKKDVQVHIVKTMENIRKKIRENLTTEDLAVWFGTKNKSKGSKQPKGPWVNICRKEDGKHPPCGRDKATGKGYPKCRAVGVAARMTDAQKKAACAQKRRAEKEEPKVGKGNKPTMTSYKPRKESLDIFIKKVLRESRFSEELNYSFIIKMLVKMYGYQINDINTLKNFERTLYYTPTNDSFDYMEQYNGYMTSKKMGYLKEVTDSSSTGSYETPGFLAKNIPNMRQGAKTTYGGPGGKFVKIKAKCRKFPYCNQGSVDEPIELSNKYKGESSLSGEMELTPTYPKGYKGNVHLPKTKWINEGLEYSGRDITKLPVIGKVITHPIGPYGEGEENVVEIIKGNNGEDIYVTDKWYKEYKRIPLIIHSKLVKDYIPSSINESKVISIDDIKRIQEEGIKDNILLGYDRLRNESKDIIPGGKSSGMSIYDIAKKHKVSTQIAIMEWVKGVKVEMEHTTSKKIAKEIAKDHLFEDIFYYRKLSKIEK
jgi:hypothetical protein